MGVFIYRPNAGLVHSLDAHHPLELPFCSSDGGFLGSIPVLMALYIKLGC